ncbi:hypothetical protein [Streptomyces sp. NPDC053755]|uniref:hypothetical protein n=1 Tax=Streptomyces sp. NPDC053755 TaxID=3155815 RepID=UPI003430D1BE
MEIAALPYIDEHATVVPVGADAVWRALLDALEGSFAGSGGARYARLVGCADRTASGPRPLAEGSALPGFRVTVADPGRELSLEGRHRFSTYALTFRLDDAGPGRTRLRAESRGAFPGPAGRVYRGLAIGTGGHAVGMRRLLGSIARRCA